MASPVAAQYEAGNGVGDKHHASDAGGEANLEAARWGQSSYSRFGAWFAVCVPWPSSCRAARAHKVQTLKLQ